METSKDISESMKLEGGSNYTLWAFKMKQIFLWRNYGLLFHFTVQLSQGGHLDILMAYTWVNMVF